ncbi:MAG: hypothetical protein BAA01_16595 [Bacillus thermozeamaize]|mgnify:FL=1|jgi:hypothetical protein|uniref:YolD-like family protein n=1 Tax=Bacillus thermozeamaize TaxID=230954 RepID=A0A1Y3PI59_9BACI|nr:MAG: hypothetical protein BAA01_16595 [Bacillus thermozeamaize]
MTGIFDRGSKKWVSLMIPELREGLEQWFNEEVKERPEMDEQLREELSWRIHQAWKTERKVTIRYWGEHGEREAVGRIVRFEMDALRLVTDDGKIHIDVEKILDVIES